MSRFMECSVTCSQEDKDMGACTCDHLWNMRIADPEGCKFYEPPRELIADEIKYAPNEKRKRHYYFRDAKRIVENLKTPTQNR